MSLRKQKRMMQPKKQSTHTSNGNSYRKASGLYRGVCFCLLVLSLGIVFCPSVWLFTPQSQQVAVVKLTTAIIPSLEPTRTTQLTVTDSFSTLKSEN